MLGVGLNSMSGIHKRDASRVISQVSYNSLGRYVTLNFIRDKWEEMNKAYVDCNTRSTPKTLIICLFLYTVSSRFPVGRISPSRWRSRSTLMWNWKRYVRVYYCFRWQTLLLLLFWFSWRDGSPGVSVDQRGAFQSTVDRPDQEQSQLDETK